MAVDNSNGTALKTEIDLYGDDDNFDQLQQDEVVVGDLLDEEEFKTEDAPGTMDQQEHDLGERKHFLESGFPKFCLMVDL